MLTNIVLIQADKHVSCVAGYEFCEIEDCVKWMVPFAMALREVGSSKLKHFSGIAPEDLHNIQTHIDSFDLLVCMCKQRQKAVCEISEVLFLWFKHTVSLRNA